MDITIDNYLRVGYIERSTDVLVTAPIFMAKKKDGGRRFIYDCKRFNKNFYPATVKQPTAFTPLMKDFTYAAKIDISACFHHFKLARSFQKYFGFTWKN